MRIQLDKNILVLKEANDSLINIDLSIASFKKTLNN